MSDEKHITEIKYKQSCFNIWQEDQGKIYLMNTYARSIVEVNPVEKEFIKQLLNDDSEFIQNPKANEYRNILIKQGLLIDAKYDEKKILGYCYHQSHFSDDYFRLTLLPTMRCNFKCPYCFESEKSLHWNNEILESLKNFAAKYFPAKKIIQLGFFGGEPLLEWERMKEFLDTCIELKMKNDFEFHIGITTNGYLLDEDKAAVLIDNYNCTSFQITIDGCQESHDRTRVLHSGESTFNKVLKNFKTLLRLKASGSVKDLYISLRINLLNNTTEEIDNFLNNFTDQEKNLFFIYFRPIYNTEKFCISNKNDIDLEQFYTLLDKRKFRRMVTKQFSYSFCEGDSGINTFQIMPDLSLWKCMNDTSCSDAKIGHITTNGELSIEMSKLANWSCNDPFCNEICQNCVYLPLCYGGCPLQFVKTSRKTCFHEKNFNLAKHLLS